MNCVNKATRILQSKGIKSIIGEFFKKENVLIMSISDMDNE